MIAVVAKWSSFEFDRQRHFATVAICVRSVSDEERLTELSTLITAMDKYHIRPAFDAQDQVFGNFQELR
jgi:hypothetical protein